MAADRTPSEVGPFTGNDIRKWMRDNGEDGWYGPMSEYHATMLAEAFCFAHDGCEAWLDDETHEIWDIASEMEQELNDARYEH